MSESQTVPLNIENRFQLQRDNIVNIVTFYQQRTFAEEVDQIEKITQELSFDVALQTDFKKGILGTEDDIIAREMYYGSNRKVIVKSKSLFQLFVNALKDPMLRILSFFACLSIILEVSLEKDHRKTAWIEGFAILVAVFLVSSVTAVNDYQKEKQFQQLNSVADARKMVSVLRGGKLCEIHQDNVFVGDLVIISEGMEIPADGLVIEASELTADESAMTGETDPMKKKPLAECIEKRNQVIAEGSKNSSSNHDIYSPILMSGTRILNGEGKFLILVVGDYSAVGKINALLRQSDIEATPLQEKLEAIARDIGKAGFYSALLVLTILLVRFAIDRIIQNHWDNSVHWVEMIQYIMVSITVIVVAIPEGLPLAVTLSLAYSVKKMLKDQNLVRKLQACETMGGANMICSDKTGTLTQNKMNLTAFWDGQLQELDTYSPKIDLGTYVIEQSKELIVQSFCTNSSANLRPVVKGSKTEIAFLEFIERCGYNYEEIREKAVIMNKYPFSSSRKRMSVVIENNRQIILLVKGASEIVLESCKTFLQHDGNEVPIDSKMKRNIEQAIEQMAGKALRTLCIAYKKIGPADDLQKKDDKGIFEVEKRDLILLGVLGIKDILRQEVPGAVLQCKKAGVRVRMVTGDNKLTARAIALECNIINPDKKSIVMEGIEFIQEIGGVVCKIHRTQECECLRDKEKARLEGKSVRVDTIGNPERFDEIYPYLDVMARSRPEDKYALVLGLVERGNVVAVTGDGTNDAPALKKADVGFAMGIAGTEVARQAADIILLDDNFSSIVKAIMWGRNIYDSIRKFLQFQLTVNVVAVLVTIIGAAILKTQIFTPIQLLWINLIMDSLASLALATESPTIELLDRKPHSRKDYIISRTMFKHILGQAILQFIIVMILVFAGDQFLPECWDSNDPVNSIYKYNPSYNVPTKEGECGIVRSGRIKSIRSSDDDYGQTYKTFPSRHFTIVYNTFVWLQIFNFINSRKIFDEMNIFQNIHKNSLFIIIVVIIIILQFLFVSFTGVAFGMYIKSGIGGLNGPQWGICIGFALTCVLWTFIIRIIPTKYCLQIGSKEVDPLKSDSKILDIRRSHRQQSFKRELSYIGSYKEPSKNLEIDHRLPVIQEQII